MWLVITQRCTNASVSGSAPAKAPNTDLNLAADAVNDLITLVWLYQIYIKNIIRLFFFFWKLHSKSTCSEIWGGTLNGHDASAYKCFFLLRNTEADFHPQWPFSSPFVWSCGFVSTQVWFIYLMPFYIIMYMIHESSKLYSCIYKSLSLQKQTINHTEKNIENFVLHTCLGIKHQSIWNNVKSKSSIWNKQQSS